MDDKKTWWYSQLSLIKSFFELLLTIFLDAALIVILWWIRTWVIRLTGVDPSLIQDRTIFWAVRITEIGTIGAVLLYVISDLIRHSVKAWKAIIEILKR
jgi:hypothetical protein